MRLKCVEQSSIAGKAWNEYWKGPPKMVSVSAIDSSQLLNLRSSALILGGPGAGKTTILRHAAQMMAHSSADQLPIFVALNRVSDASEDGLLSACGDSARSQGLDIPPGQFKLNLKAGHYRLLLDGLDETGRNAIQMRKTIELVDLHYPAASLLVTCRDSYEIGAWDGAITIKVNPFSRRQVRAFVEKWFCSQPTSVNQLFAWLDQHVEMNEVVRTPINCALLCSLVRANRDLPTNEVELYDERLNLVLGRWEQAKGISTLPVALRRGYLHFLMELAASCHSRELRLFDHAEAVKLAQKYFTEGYHTNADGMVSDCIQRGALLSESDGSLSFGHLAYQEFLTAKWLHQHQPVDFIAEKLTSPWWDNVLRFYAVICGDLSAVVEAVVKGKLSLRQANRLEELATLAPYTSMGARRVRAMIPVSKLQTRTNRSTKRRNRF